MNTFKQLPGEAIHPYWQEMANYARDSGRTEEEIEVMRTMFYTGAVCCGRICHDMIHAIKRGESDPDRVLLAMELLRQELMAIFQTEH